MESVVALAVDAPGGPPISSAEFLARLDAGWLMLAYTAGGSDEQLRLVRAAAGQVPDIALRFRTLFRRLGPGLDGPGDLADADAWYCILEGTSEITMAEAQARALVDLVAQAVTGGQTPATGDRQVLLAVDEFSAVARRLPIWQLYERARSLGLVVHVSAQSWHGLAPADADRYRIAATAEGGIWLLRSAHPEPVTELAGTRRIVTTTRWLIGFPRWSRQGSSRIVEEPVADPARIRALDVGQAAYIYRGSVSYIQVKRLVAGPAAVSGAPVSAAAPGGPAAAAGASRATAAPGPSLPDITAFLDQAFGPPAATPAARPRVARGNRRQGQQHRHEEATR
jgi:hypothetical protein